MHYLVIVVIGVVAGVIAGRFIGGGDFGVAGDVAFAVSGALLFAYLFVRLALAPDAGASGTDVMAAIGAIVGLYLRRVIKVV
jgi:uncharacterized membrane protein YeaQ/YmgE (transglycosylase-associated protein family)